MPITFNDYTAGQIRDLDDLDTDLFWRLMEKLCDNADYLPPGETQAGNLRLEAIRSCVVGWKVKQTKKDERIIVVVISALIRLGG